MTPLLPVVRGDKTFDGRKIIERKNTLGIFLLPSLYFPQHLHHNGFHLHWAGLCMPSTRGEVALSKEDLMVNTCVLCIHPHSNRSQHTVGTGFESRRMVCVPQLAATASSPSSKYNESKNKQVNIEAGSHSDRYSGGNICAKRGVFILHWHCWLIVNLC